MTENAKATEFTLKATTNEVPVVKILCSTDAEKFARQFYNDDIAIYESAFIILLNQGNMTIGWAKIAQGGISATIVDVRLVAKYAVDALASSVIFVHNHPSGHLVPSIQDDKMTMKIAGGLALLDIKLRDSLIIGPQHGFYSFRDEGKIKS